MKRMMSEDQTEAEDPTFRDIWLLMIYTENNVMI